MLFTQYSKYRVGKCVSIHVYVYLHIHMCSLILMPTLPLFQATTYQQGPNEHVYNDWAVHTDVMGYNEGHECNNELQILNVSAREGEAMGLSAF